MTWRLTTAHSSSLSSISVSSGTNSPSVLAAAYGVRPLYGRLESVRDRVWWYTSAVVCAVLSYGIVHTFVRQHTRQVCRYCSATKHCSTRVRCTGTTPLYWSGSLVPSGHSYMAVTACFFPNSRRCSTAPHVTYHNAEIEIRRT